MNDHRHLVPALLLSALALAGCAGEDPEAEASNVTAAIPKPTRFAPDQISVTKNTTLFKKFCTADTNVTKRPVPNYKNDLVKKAALNLTKVAGHSFALYSEIKKHHLGAIPPELDGQVSPHAHDFVTYLCGEFRDRATMIEAKLKWVGERMNYLNNENPTAWNASGDPWMQMKQDDYEPYLDLSRDFFGAKESELAEQGKSTMMIGTISADTPIPPQTVCETKYMFAEYIKKGKTFDSLEAFRAGYATFKNQSCTLPADEDHYYDFRGDSNIKPNSPESNAMIWFARTIARQCDSKAEAKPYQQVVKGSNLPVAACREYFKYPFTSRWNAARAGMAAWMLVDPMRDGLDSRSEFTIVPRSVKSDTEMFGDVGPYKALDESLQAVPLLAGWESHWKDGTWGIRKLQTGGDEHLQRILQLAVDRHTDWYASQYDDQMAVKPLKQSQAYSPFVASSYEMSASDGFVTPGTTVPVTDETALDHKHWMFVFKVHKSRWFTPESIVKGETPDFERSWFDETSFGNTGLANSEKAWDRLGSPLESELDSVLYLHNISAN